jgi:hypothetical protein
MQVSNVRSLEQVPMTGHPRWATCCDLEDALGGFVALDVGQLGIVRRVLGEACDRQAQHLRAVEVVDQRKQAGPAGTSMSLSSQTAAPPHAAGQIRPSLSISSIPCKCRSICGQRRSGAMRRKVRASAMWARVIWGVPSRSAIVRATRRTG